MNNYLFYIKMKKTILNLKRKLIEEGTFTEETQDEMKWKFKDLVCGFINSTWRRSYENIYEKITEKSTKLMG